MGSIRHMKKVVTISALLLLLTLSLGGGVASKGNDSSATYENLKLFTEVLDIVQRQYVDEVPAKDLIYGAIKGTLRGLDPHSSFLDPEMYKEMQVETSGSFGGLGIEITLKDDVLTVVAPIEGTPAYRAGVHPGDRIVKIEGLTTKDMQLTDAVKRMRGKPGSKITITIVREGWTEPKDFQITREQIRVQSVKNQQLEPGIEYIRLRQFQEQTASDLDGALEKYTKDNRIQGLILDLRNNPGGLLTSSVEVTEKFIDSGRLVVYTEGRVRNQNMRFSSNAKRVFTDFPKLGDVPVCVTVKFPPVASIVPSADPAGETLLQGAIDLVFEEEDRWVVVDYKSDIVSENRESLVDFYRPQVERYRRYWEKLTGKKTTAGLYFIHTGEEVWL